MKRLLLILTSVIFVISSTAQEKKKDNTPPAVKAAFAEKFPNAQKVSWSVEKPGEFEAEFVLNGTEASAVFDEKGILAETETEIRENDLPQPVKNTLAKDFAGYKLGEINKAGDAKGIVTYELQASKGKDAYELSFDSNGKLLNKEELKKGKGEKD